MEKTFIQSLNINKFKIFDSDYQELSETQSKILFKTLFEDAYKAQNVILNKYRKNPFPIENSGHSAKEARQLGKWKVPNRYTYKHNTNEMAQREVFRIISTYQERLKLAKELEKHNWDISYNDFLPNEYVDFELFKNLLRMRRLPKLGKINNPRICFGYTNNDFSDKPYIQDNFIIWENVTLLNKSYNFVFQIPIKQLLRYENIIKVSKPTLRLEKETNIIYFDFSIFPTVAKPIEKNEIKNYVGVDLGIVRPITCSYVENNKLAGEFEESIYSKNHSKKLEILTKELFFIKRKLKRKSGLGINCENLYYEGISLSNKISNIKKSLSWSLATDIVSSFDNETMIVLENLRWIGGHTRWNAGDFKTKIKHQAKKYSKNISFVNAKNTSQKCSICDNKISHNGRIVYCSSCKIKKDRDSNSSQNIVKKKTQVNNLGVYIEVLSSQRSFNKFPRVSYTGDDATICSTKNTMTSLAIVPQYRIVNTQVLNLAKFNDYNILLNS